MRAHGARLGKRLGFELRDELDEFPLQRRRICALVAGDKVGYRGLGLQRTQSLGDGLIVDGREVEGGVELAGFHVADKCLPVSCAWITDTVLPDGVEMVLITVGTTAEITIQVAVAVRFK